MYDHLYTNACKELFEYPYYSFIDHWGRATPSHPPRAAMRSYLEGRFKKYGEPSWIKYNTVVRHVVFDDATQKFTVTSRNFEDPKDKVEEFDYVICCTGHFSYPNVPSLPCYDDFMGTIIHAHDQRTFHNYKDKTIMVVGAKFSAEDIASIAYKYGAKRIVCTYKNKPMDWKWPDCFETHPLPHKIVGKRVYFPDGGEVDVDYIILCTGYLLKYPFMDEKIRLESKPLIIPDMLYKSLTLLSNNKCFYLGMQAQPFTFLMTDVQAFYVRDVIMGKLTLPDAKAQQAWLDGWKARQAKFNGTVDSAQG